MRPNAFDVIRRHAEETYPRECCGCLLGNRHGGGWEAIEAMPTRNLVPEASQDRYQLDPAGRLTAEKRARELGLEVIGFYHSHPDHDVYFSATDLQNSEEFLLGQPWLPPTNAYVVVSVREGSVQDRGAFFVEEGVSKPLALEVAS